MVSRAWTGLVAAGLVIDLTAACTTAGAREREFVRQNLAGVIAVAGVRVSCDDAVLFAGGEVCATVAMSEGPTLRFRGLGYHSFGPASSRVRVEAAGGRAPLVVSCDAQSSFADFDRNGLFGHHFSPGLDDVAMAIRRRREVIKELEFWPQCPQFWEVGAAPGPLYRYCAHGENAMAEPPPRPCDQSLDRTK